MMTIGEQRHAAVVEAQLRRIADALENIIKCLDAFGEMMHAGPFTYEELKEKGASE